MANHLLLLLSLLLPACADALLPPAAAGPALLRRSGPSLHRSTAPLLAAEGTPPPPQAAWRLGDELDKRIASLALPAVVSFMILPIAQATDLFWVGRMGEALAVAGQSAANQVYSTCSMVTSTIPTILTPRVAAAHANGNKEEVQKAIGESIVISAMIGIVVTAALWFLQMPALLALGNRNALRFSVPYLRSRLPGIVLEGTSVVGFASFRGVMDTVTPLQVSALSNLVNVCLDPFLMFTMGMGIAGAGAATAASQLFSAVAYLTLLLKRQMVTLRSIRLPSADSLKKLATAGGAVQLRSVALNVAFIAITKKVQGLDATGTAAAAHAVTIQLWQLGGVILFALSTVASIIVPSELNRKGGGPVSARASANRLLSWGACLGGLLGAMQLAAIPYLGVLTPLPEVQRAAVVPSILGAVLQLINGITFIGEGVMVGTQSFGPLATFQVVATAALLLALRFAPLLIGESLNSVWVCFFVFNGIRFLNVVRHHWFTGPLVPARIAAGK